MINTKILFLSFLFFNSFFFAQRFGIRTENPQGTFHVDGNADNPKSGAPSAAQANNDFIVASNGQIGIGVIPATEKLDVNGNGRVRNLADGSNSITFPQTVVANANGVLGVYQGAPARDVTATPVPTVDTNSTAMFVIRRFSVGDNPNFDTGMAFNDWEAMMSNVAYTINTASGSGFVPNSTRATGYVLSKATGTTWRIFGDIPGPNEGTSFVDILFIKKNYVPVLGR
ncbi:hypothetical protein IQ37_06545 [Chryseobacterium piperi]|uniref:Uncharacterized protein n=1 Tax=Chryseobacterium piperi TaxID=558152 RepID=A0A086BJV0_9FLAO|nr:hypothetical protein [Chryseobacterium piperi]ASW73769.1 hypothetical protein CJF12_05345 [Chryseobacterium piperi]KFF29214.1 hypothetical protein IQ37_06545 [Chryseobacterium piperi]